MTFRYENLIELEEFFPDIEPELPRCPTPVIEMRIRDAIIEACERAHIWRWDHPEIPVIEGVQEYDLLTPAADLLVHSILSFTLDGRSMDGHSYNEVNHHESVNVRSQRGYSVTDRGRIRLTSKPIRSSSPLTIRPILGAVAIPNPSRPHTGIRALLSIKPSRTTLEVSEVLARDYYQLIVTGSLAKALKMRERPWTDMRLAQVKEREFEVLLGKAKQGIDIGFRTDSQRFRARKFA